MEFIIHKEKTRSENSDWISNLPDSLLIDILSLLDPRDAARTCILSKRWHNLWTFVPSLSFDMEKFKGKAENFNNFVSSFLQLRDKASDVHKFALRYAVGLDTKFSDLIWAWIMYASERKVKNLVVHLFGWPCHFLSNNGRFHCDTLENLHLCGIVLMEADDVCLHKLKTLSLINVTAHGESMQKLLSGCPALITLIMCYCRIYTSSISFGSVKSLTIQCCTLGTSNPPPFSISAPCVEYLEFVEGKGARVTFNDMSRVTKAIIGGLGVPGRTAHSFHLLNAIKEVQDLEFTCIYLEVLYLNRELHKCGIFNKLKNLRLGFGCKCRDYSTLLSSFLKHCPNLEYLCLLHDEDFCDCEEPHGDMFSKIGQQQYEGFHGRHLKLVTFDSRTLCQQNLLPRVKKAFLQWNKEV